LHFAVISGHYAPAGNRRQHVVGDWAAFWRHVVNTCLGAAAIFGAAIGFGFLEVWCRKQGLPNRLCEGVMVVSFVLFCIDGILICGGSAIVMYKLLARIWKSDEI
jgi:hypothetical protein